MGAKATTSFLIGILACIAFSVATAIKIDVPNTKLSLTIDAKLTEDKTSVEDFGDDFAEYAQDVSQHGFETANGVYGTVLAFHLKKEHEEVTEEWSEMAAEGIASIASGEVKLTRRESAKFGSATAHLISLSVEESGKIVNSQFVVIGKKGEIIVIALTSDSDNLGATKEVEEIINTLSYDGQKCADRKEVTAKPE